MTLKTSVVIPTYNRAGLLSRALESALSQSLPADEILVVDDASTDNTKAVVEGLKVPRLRYFRHQNRSGAAAARNTGIRASHGLYIALLDSDDVWHPSKLARQVEVLDQAPPEVGAVYSGFWRIMPEGPRYIPDRALKVKEGRLFIPLLRGEYLIYTSAILVRKCVFEEIGLFDIGFQALEEQDLWMRMAHSYEFRFIDEPLGVSYYTAGSLSTDRRLFLESYQKLYEKHRQAFAADKKADSIMQGRMARQFFALHQWPSAFRFLWRSMNRHPPIIGSLLRESAAAACRRLGASRLPKAGKNSSPLNRGS